VRPGRSERKIQVRLLVPLSFLFFALANLFDDERREHSGILLPRTDGLHDGS